MVSDKVPPPLPPSTIVEWNPALRPGQLGNEVTSVLRPILFWPHGKTAIHFLVKKPSSIRSPDGQFFLWPKSCFEVSIDCICDDVISGSVARSKDVKRRRPSDNDRAIFVLGGVTHCTTQSLVSRISTKTPTTILVFSVCLRGSYVDQTI